MVHLESHVATKTFTQVNRTVKTLVAPTGNAISGTGQMAGWGGTTITLTGGATPFSDDYMTVHDLVLWNPTGDGRANLSQLKTDGTHGAYLLDEPYWAWNFCAGPVPAVYGCSTDINSPIHDPDVRALYPNAPCRTTDASLVVDVNMGGGAATIRAAPFTKDMCKMTPATIRNHLLADRHTVSVIDIGGHDPRSGGAKDKRIIFPKWVQSRKAVGEFTVAKINLPLTTQPDDGETDSKGMAALYTDEFCYGGWVMMFENIAPAAAGSVPFVRMASVVTIQVQLSLSDNHLKEQGKGLPFDKYLRDHEKLTGKPGGPKTTTVSGSPVEAALVKKEPPAKAAAPKAKAKQGRGQQSYQGPAGHARRGPQLRGNLPQQQQQQKSQDAKQNRAQTAAQAQRLANKVMSSNGKPAGNLKDFLIELFGGPPQGPGQIKWKEGL
jgi:hypothetical protein